MSSSHAFALSVFAVLACTPQPRSEMGTPDPSAVTPATVMLEDHRAPTDETAALEQKCRSGVTFFFQKAQEVTIDTITVEIQNDTAEVDGYARGRFANGDTPRVQFYCQSVRAEDGSWKRTHSGFHPDQG